MNGQPPNTHSTGFRKLITYTGIILAVNLSFLFSPQPVSTQFSADICIESYIHINRYMGFPVNCDAISFMSAAIRPSVLFQQGYIRQSRPAYILIGTIVGYSVYYISYPLHPWLEKKLQGHLSTVDSEKNPRILVLYACFYLSFILINTVLLLITLLLFEKITFGLYRNRPTGSSIFPLMLVLLISTPLCKAFFWTVHLQLFNILMPVLALYIGLSLTQKPKKFNTLLLISFLSGCLVLFYANAVLLLPTICFCYLTEIRNRKRYIPAKEWLRSASLIPVFFSSAIGWVLLLHMIGITIYNNEVTVAREFVWMTDILYTQGSLYWKEFAGNTKAFIRTFPVLGFPALVLLIVWVRKRKDVSDAFRQIRVSPRLQSDVTIITFITCLFLLFYWLMGFYASRLTIAFNPFIVYATTLVLVKQQSDRRFTILLLLMVMSIHLYTVLSYGPFS